MFKRKRVFISYVDSHHEAACKVRDELSARGINSFLAAENMRPGENFHKKIFLELGRCDALFLVVSENSCDSLWISTEVGVAYALRKSIYPILTDRGVKLPELIRNCHASHINDLPKVVSEYIENKSLGLLKYLFLIILIAGISCYLFWRAYNYNGNHNSVYYDVLQRGYLRCGINGGAPILSQFVEGTESRKPYQKGYWNATGFDADFCRAVAAAIFGKRYSEYIDERNRGNVLFIRTTTDDRFEKIVNKEVDVLFRNTTWTFDRDMEHSVDFGPPVLYDFQAYLVRDASGITTIDDMAGKEVCLAIKSTQLDYLNAEVKKRNLNIKIISRQQDGSDFESGDQVAGAFAQG